MNKTSIEWTDYTWNPVTGCTKVSQGCKNCYAETMTTRFEKVWGHSFKEVVCHQDRLNEPITMGKRLHGKKVFVCDMSDLFHEDVPERFIMEVIQVITICKDTTFQILTKRIERALDFFNRFVPKYFNGLEENYFPIQNLWIGTSCEDQKTANERIPCLIHIPAVVHFISCEPLLGPIDLRKIDPRERLKSEHVFCYDVIDNTEGPSAIQWIIAGGESGRSARPMHPDWVRSLRDQCSSCDVPFFFKQWGEWMPISRPLTSSEINVLPEVYKSSNFLQFSSDIINEDNAEFYRAGKSQSGNKLDGKQYLQFPETINQQPL